MEPHNLIIVIGLILSVICKTYSLNCDKTPDDVIKPKNINDIDRYIIIIQGNPKTYTPYQRYNVSLKSNPSQPPHKPFKRFILTAEPRDSKTQSSAGQFDIEYGAEILTTFSENCPNTVIQNSILPKTEIQVYWTAPSEGSGCVVLKATVIESRENWFSEDGQLTKTLCEDSGVDENVQPTRLRTCCACAEAKYEVAFEGKWTRNTHPRYYPSDRFKAKFSDIIGASHRKRHSFWNEGDKASDGLKELAETGSTKSLESELKEMSEYIRTIIKARGLQHPNITQSTYAVFRVDNRNHRVSLVSKITPSPDWFVGVSDFELCKADCTWIESYTYNLYPLDAGTDDGIEYTNSQPLINRRYITPITQNNPNDPRSPFYNNEGAPMNPIARLHFTRQRLYNKPCEKLEDEENCATNEWSDWSPCSVKCGQGKQYRHREYTNPSSRYLCNVELYQSTDCMGSWEGCETVQPETETTTEEEIISTISPDDPRCDVGEWSSWSSCSVSCGFGTKTRDRVLLKPENEEICKGVELQENTECKGGIKDCKEVQPDCPDTNWGEWSTCNATKCGKGYKMRLRLPSNSESYEKKSDTDDENEQNCSNQEIVECYVPCEKEDSESNNIGSRSFVIEEKPDGKVVDCKVSNWSIWSECKINGAKCGRGNKTRERQILRHPKNGGKACPSKLFKRRKCYKPCYTPTTSTTTEYAQEEISDEFLSKLKECIMSHWSSWSPCSTNCGASALQLRTRRILYRPPGVTCPTRLQQRRCNLPLACTEDRKPILL